MSLDRIERRIEFIIEQQARFATDLAALASEVRELADASIQRDRQMASLADALLGLTHTFEQEREQTGRRLRELFERSKEADERLAALIVVVDRLVPRRNGG